MRWKAMFLIVDDQIEQRVYRLDPMGPSTPILIGSGADVAIPFASENVAEHHCGVFMSGGHWFVKDLGSESGTFVNGVQARFSTPIIAGDRITLGEYQGAPSMVFSETKPPKPGDAEGFDSDLMPLPQVHDELAQPFNPGIQQTPVSDYTAPGRKTGMSPEAVLAGGLVMLVLLAIGVFFIYRLSESKQNAIAVANTPPPAPATMPVKVIVVPAPKPVPTAPVTPAQSAPTQPGVDPRASDEDWKKVDEAHRMAAPAVAILAYDDYRSRHPDTEWKKDLDAYTDDALDRIWWQRLKDVITEQANLHKQLQPLEAHLKELSATSSDPKRKQELTDQIADLKKHLKDLEAEQFVTMKYTRAEVPDIYDSTQLEALRKERDPAAYEAWKKEVLASIRKTRGSLPW